MSSTEAQDKKPPIPADSVTAPSKSFGFGPPLYGVRSYLHQFYQTGEKNLSIYEDQEGDEYILQAADFDLQGALHFRAWYQRPVVWKAMLWIGINFLVFGVIGIFVSYLVPREKTYVQTPDQHYYVIQKSAEEYNSNLELVKLIALSFFCSGALVTVVALLIPSVFWRDCMDSGGRGSRTAHLYAHGWDAQEPIRVRIRPAAGSRGGVVTLAAGKHGSEAMKAEAQMPPEYSAVTATNTSVQPQRKAEEAFLTTEGLKPVVTTVQPN